MVCVPTESVEFVKLVPLPPESVTVPSKLVPSIVNCTVPLGERTVIVVRHTAGWEVLLEAPRPRRGERSRALKLRGQRLAGDTLVLDVEGVAGTTYVVPVRMPTGMKGVTIEFPPGGDSVDGYVALSVRVLPR